MQEQPKIISIAIYESISSCIKIQFPDKITMELAKFFPVDMSYDQKKIELEDIANYHINLYLEDPTK